MRCHALPFALSHALLPSVIRQFHAPLDAGPTAAAVVLHAAGAVASHWHNPPGRAVEHQVFPAKEGQTAQRGGRGRFGVCVLVLFHDGELQDTNTPCRQFAISAHLRKDAVPVKPCVGKLRREAGPESSAGGSFKGPY